MSCSAPSEPVTQGGGKVEGECVCVSESGCGRCVTPGRESWCGEVAPIQPALQQVPGHSGRIYSNYRKLFLGPMFHLSLVRRAVTHPFPVTL